MQLATQVTEEFCKSRANILPVATIPVKHMSAEVFCTYASTVTHPTAFTKYTEQKTKVLEEPLQDTDTEALLAKFLTARDWRGVGQALKTPVDTVKAASVILFFESLVLRIAAEIPEDEATEAQRLIRKSFNDQVQVAMSSFELCFKASLGDSWDVIKVGMEGLKFAN